MAVSRRDDGGRMASVRRNYDVPAERGREVMLLLYDGPPERARIISSTGSHLYARLTRNGRRVGPLHPCWKIDYLDGRGDRTGQPTPMDRALGMPDTVMHCDLRSET